MHSEGGRRPWCGAKYTQHPPCMAKNVPKFYPDFTSERWTLMELRRLDNVHPEGVPWVANYAYGELPRNMPFLYVWFVVNIRETSKGCAMHFE